MWQSADPILDQYLPNLSDRINAESNGDTYLPEKKLKGQGGIYNPVNMGLYTYVHNRPLVLIDPNGTDTFGVSFNLTGGGGASAKLTGVTVGVLFAKDDNGNVGVFGTYGFGPYIAAESVSVTANIEKTNAENVSELSGVGLQGGGSVSIGKIVLEGGVLVTGKDRRTGSYKGGGFGIGSPISVSGMVTYTQDLTDLASQLLPMGEVKDLLNDAEKGEQKAIDLLRDMGSKLSEQLN